MIKHMSNGAQKVTQGEYLFKEGDIPDAMYVIKSGRFEVIKAKGAEAEFKLAELGPGALVGEMAFFDNKPRSASVRAIRDSEVIALSYQALHAQFKNFPEWSKAIMRTVNEHLRKANQRIKELEKATSTDDVVFPPHLINKLIAILAFTSLRYGKILDDALNTIELNGNILRKYTIQIFQESTLKMQKLLETLAKLNYLKIESTGDGNQKIILNNLTFLFEFVEWHNKYLFQTPEERSIVEEKEIQIINGLLHFAKKLKPNDQGLVKLNLTEVQNDSMRELQFLIRIDDTHSLVTKKLIGDHQMEEGGIYSFLAVANLEKLSPFWTLIYTLKRIVRYDRPVKRSW